MKYTYKLNIDKVEKIEKEESVKEKTRDWGKQSIIQKSELGEALKELNDDSYDEKTRMSEIDMRTRLFYSEIAGLLAIDTLVSFRFLPKSCLLFTRKKKRLNVSLKGLGREEIVNITTNQEDKKVSTGRSLWDRLTGKKQET